MATSRKILFNTNRYNNMFSIFMENADVIPIGITLYSRNLPEDVSVWLVCVVVVLRHSQQYFSYEVFAMAFYLVINLATCNI
jgi:hypothetical protein